MWYDLKPAEYADYLRFCASRNDESAKVKDAEGKPWSSGEAERSRRQARRLRAMAALCEASDAERAGNIDFRGLSDPTTPLDVEDAVVADIETAA